MVEIRAELESSLKSAYDRMYAEKILARNNKPRTTSPTEVRQTDAAGLLGSEGMQQATPLWTEQTSGPAQTVNGSYKDC